MLYVFMFIYQKEKTRMVVLYENYDRVKRNMSIL